MLKMKNVAVSSLRRLFGISQSEKITNYPPAGRNLPGTDLLAACQDDHSLINQCATPSVFSMLIDVE